MAVSVDFTEEIINRAWTKADEMHADMNDRLNELDTALGASVGSTPPNTVVEIDAIEEPDVTIPTETIGDIDVFAAKRTELIDELALLFADYMGEYFPLDNALNSKAEQWLTDALTPGVDGIPAVETALWDRDRDRILEDAERAEDDLMSAFAARGFPMPPGALAAAVARVQTKGQEEIAKSSREALIRAQETVRFAVEQALNLRRAALASAADYIKSLVAGGDSVMQVAGNAQSNLISAAASFYNARTNAEDTMFKSRLANTSMANDILKTNTEGAYKLVESKAALAASSAQTVATAAAAALNNLHTSVGVQGREDV